VCLRLSSTEGRSMIVATAKTERLSHKKAFLNLKFLDLPPHIDRRARTQAHLSSGVTAIKSVGRDRISSQLAANEMKVIMKEEKDESDKRRKK
jgi:hypothetical protein